MPRDLDLEEDKPAPSVQLTESPNRLTESPNKPEENEPIEPIEATEYQRSFTIVPKDQQYSGPTNLHPYTRPLTISDLESVVALEIAAFPDPNERATREKLIYRLTKCNELCLGIFCTVLPGSNIKAETLATGRPVETSRRNGAVSVLLGHVIAAKTDSPLVDDDSMDYPQDWQSEHPKPSKLGHIEAGRTIALHSVAILPAFQKRGLGRILMMCYMQTMNGAGIADRLSLISHDHKLQWYEKLAFINKGKSECKYGNGGWYDMVFDLKAIEARASYG